MSIHASMQEIVRQWGEQQPEGRYPDPDGTARDMVDAFRAEILNEQEPGEQETLGEAAAMYRMLRDAIVETMDDPNDWDGDGDEGSILANYVRWLAMGKPGTGADFFLPKTTYQRARWLFQCLAVEKEPFTSDVVAIGFLFRDQDGTSSIHRMRQDDWDLGEWLPVEAVQL